MFEVNHKRTIYGIHLKFEITKSTFCIETVRGNALKWIVKKYNEIRHIKIFTC